MGNTGKNDKFGSDPSEGTSHPVGKTVGAASGAAIGAAAGSSAGPIGTVGGALIGGIAGWLEGKTIAEGVNPDDQLRYWNSTYAKRPYFKSERTWEDYQPAYQSGIYSYDPDSEFEDVENDLSEDWEQIRGTSRLSWSEARDASRDAWSRLSDNSDLAEDDTERKTTDEE